MSWSRVEGWKLLRFSPGLTSVPSKGGMFLVLLKRDARGEGSDIKRDEGFQAGIQI